jgi:5-methyltetrahydrofolate--homocysteine methyltransferase
VLWVTAPRRGAVTKPSGEAALPPDDAPTPPKDVRARWLDPSWRVRQFEHEIARTYFGAEAHPRFDPQLGPGNLATFIGSEPRWAADTVWFDPLIDDPDRHPALAFDPANRHFRAQMAIVEAGLAAGRGRWPVTYPDLIENVDILVSLRGMESLLEDMLDRPCWVEEQVAAVNRIFYAVYDLMRERLADAWSGTHWGAFCIYGEGRTAKVQCDASAAFGPPQLRRFVVPALAEQCRWLDHSLYHLDGTQCLCHLDELLGIDALDAVEWTPQAGRPQGGDPQWFDIYRRIRAAGKCVQAVSVEPAEVVPLLDAVGPRGLFIMTRAGSEDEARRLEERVDRYRETGG